MRRIGILTGLDEAENKIRIAPAAEKCDELAPSHCLPRGSGQGIVAAQTCTGKDPASCPLRVGRDGYNGDFACCLFCGQRGRHMVAM